MLRTQCTLLVVLTVALSPALAFAGGAARHGSAGSRGSSRPGDGKGLLSRARHALRPRLPDSPITLRPRLPDSPATQRPTTAKPITTKHPTVRVRAENARSQRRALARAASGQHGPFQRVTGTVRGKRVLLGVHDGASFVPRHPEVIKAVKVARRHHARILASASRQRQGSSLQRDLRVSNISVERLHYWGVDTYTMDLHTRFEGEDVTLRATVSDTGDLVRFDIARRSRFGDPLAPLAFQRIFEAAAADVAEADKHRGHPLNGASHRHGSGRPRGGQTPPALQAGIGEIRRRPGVSGVRVETHPQGWAVRYREDGARKKTIVRLDGTLMPSAPPWAADPDPLE